jgi:hypothetical protein
MSHKVKVSTWEKGVLTHRESEFNYKHEAHGFAKKIKKGLIKIYDDLNKLIHSWESGFDEKDNDSYA